MISLAFDTHKFVTDLNKAGMSTELAEVLANHYASLLDDRIATKSDVAMVSNDLTVLEERMKTRLIAGQLATIITICAILGSLTVLLQS